MTVAEAPAGLQAAVRSTLGRPSTPYSYSGQQAELTVSDGAANDQFGFSVAISGSTAVVGAPIKNSQTGAAYVYVSSGTSWSQQAELTASDGAVGDNFGISVAISGSTAVVGASFKNSLTGAAYVFVRSGTTWSQQAKLAASDSAIYDDFGWSVAISGSTVVVGAYGKRNFTGAAYVFVGSGTSWSQQAELTASDSAVGDNFGFSVAISGSTAVVGAIGKRTYTGAAYVFVASGSSWSQQSELAASDGAVSDNFGWSVAISGSNAVVGAPEKSSYIGAAYVYMGSGTTWPQRAELTASDGTTGESYGMSVAVSGSTAVVGAPDHGLGAGAAYVYAYSGTTWPQQAELIASDGVPNDLFGHSVAIAGSTLVVGAPQKNSYTGAAYVFRFVQILTNPIWAGYVQLPPQGTQYTAVAAIFTVPAVNLSAGCPNQNNPCRKSSTWVGIGGYGPNSSNLIQDGIEADLNQNGTATYYAWTEILPAAQLGLTLTISAGDRVLAVVEETAVNTWAMAVRDLTTGKTAFRTVAYSSSMSSAEVIHERTNVSGGSLPLTQTNNVVFGPAAYATSAPSVNPTWQYFFNAPAGAALVETVMAGAYGSATPSAVDSDNDGFQVADGTAAPPPPAS